LIGEGPAADAIARQAPEHVRLYGQVASLRDYIATADIGLLPSFFVGESMPLVLLEMMAYGKPIVATDVGEIADIVGEGPEAAGVVVPLREGKVDVPGFIKAIVDLLDEKRRNKIGTHARHRFESRYTMDHMIAAYGDVYRGLTEARKDDALRAH
jgi:glycosyltransferase involved in cell wall biosynthesis